MFESFQRCCCIKDQQAKCKRIIYILPAGWSIFYCSSSSFVQITFCLLVFFKWKLEERPTKQNHRWKKKNAISNTFHLKFRMQRSNPKVKQLEQRVRTSDCNMMCAKNSNFSFFTDQKNQINRYFSTSKIKVSLEEYSEIQRNLRNPLGSFVHNVFSYLNHFNAVSGSLNETPKFLLLMLNCIHVFPIVHLIMEA